MNPKSSNRSIRLLRTPRPYPDESLKGYMVRTTETNGYENPAYLLRFSGMKSYLGYIGFVMNWHALSKLLNVEIPALKIMAHCHVSNEDLRQKTCEFFGYHLPKYHIRTCQAKICPSCLKDSNYLRKAWDLAALTVCPIHKTFLIDVCPGCGGKISWDRNQVSVCVCNYDWRKLEVMNLKESDLVLSHQILTLCKIDLESNSLLNKFKKSRNPLFSLSLSDLLSTIFFISGQLKGISDAMGRYQASSLENLQLHRNFIEALPVFDNWPNNYFKFLEDLKGKMPKYKGQNGIYADFGSFYASLYNINNYGKGKNTLTLPAFLKSGFEEYLVKVWKGVTTKIKRISKTAHTNKKYLTLEEAMEYLNTPKSWILRYIETKALNASIYNVGKKRQFLIESESVKKLMALHKSENMMTHAQVVNYLGAGRNAVGVLVQKGCLSAFRGPIVDGYANWVFEKNTVHDFLEHLNEHIQKPSKMQRGGLITFHTTIRKLGILGIDAGQLIKLILDGKIVPYFRMTPKNVSDFMFDNEAILKYISLQMKILRKQSVSADGAGKILGVRQETVAFLVKSKLIATTKERIWKPSFPEIAIDEINRFKSNYIFTGDLARKLGTSSRFLIKQLIAKDILPVSGRKVDHRIPYVLKKSDIEGVNLSELIRRGREESVEKMKTYQLLRYHRLKKLLKRGRSSKHDQVKL